MDHSPSKQCFTILQIVINNDQESRMGKQAVLMQEVGHVR